MEAKQASTVMNDIHLSKWRANVDHEKKQIKFQIKINIEMEMKMKTYKLSEKKNKNKGKI